MRRALCTLALITAALPVLAQDTTPDAPALEVEAPMTQERLTSIVRAIDPDARAQGNLLELTIEDIPVLVVTDPGADRMRAMVPIRSAERMTTEELMRVMQANFDTALDARYAVARGRLWGVFIHPLGALEREQFISALIQTVNVARTYGQSYSGGAVVYGSGDSNEIFRDLLEDLLNRGEDL
ncbi:hypothetical protein ACS3SW_07085 [Roseobacteraceae bacterium S113]